MIAILLCAGHGTRLRPLTDTYPKAMLPVAGRPLLGYTLPWLAANGVSDVVINLHHLGDQIRAFVGDGSAFGVHVRYLEEAELQGTAGTVRLADPLLGEDDVLVVYGDLLLDVDLAPLFARHRVGGADATLLVHRRVGSNSVIDLDDDGRIRAFVERPRDGGSTADSWVNSGVQVLGPAVRELIRDTGARDLPRDVYSPHHDRLRLLGHPLTGFRCALDSVERLRLADEAVRSERVRVH